MSKLFQIQKKPLQFKAFYIFQKNITCWNLTQTDNFYESSNYFFVVPASLIINEYKSSEISSFISNVRNIRQTYFLWEKMFYKIKKVLENYSIFCLRGLFIVSCIFFVLRETQKMLDILSCNNLHASWLSVSYEKFVNYLGDIAYFDRM